MSSSFAHRRTRKRVQAAKSKARSELNECGWKPHRIVENKTVDLDIRDCRDTIRRVDATKLTVDEFREQFERQSIPVILTGLTTEWPAQKKWTVSRLYKKYRNQRFKCGEDDHGYSVKLKMKYYIDYMLDTDDDSPLYIFDSSFGDRNKTDKLLNDYTVPPMFADDLFRYAAEKRRPPYRWMVVARSGTAIHIDPLGTSAWNGLISGHKKWCLIHPSAPKALVKPRKEESGKHPDEAVTWFDTVYKHVTSSNWYREYPVVHAVQHPGEVMFVPSGWWHVVMNLDITIAVTQNFCSLSNLHQVWPKTVRSRPKFAKHWLRALQKERSEIVEMISEISRSTDWHRVAEEDSSDSSSSSSSSSSSESEDSGTEINDPLPITSRKRKLSLRIEDFQGNEQQSNWNRTATQKHNQNDCQSKLRRSP